MGCHAWTYKKVSSLTKDELNEHLDSLCRKEFMSAVYRETREEYVTGMVEMARSELDELYYYESDPHVDVYEQIQWAREHRDPDVSGRYWDECHERMVRSCQRKDEFIGNPDADYREFLDICDGMDLMGVTLTEHKGDRYLNVMFDSVFRCRRYNDCERIETYDDMIAFLKDTPEGLIEYYKYDEEENLVIVKGLCDELVAYLKDLYKDNDVFVEFG